MNDQYKTHPSVKASWESEYGFTKEMEFQVRKFMAYHSSDCENSTQLAELTADCLNCDEWLDIENHPIWDLALEYDPENYGRS